MSLMRNISPLGPLVSNIFLSFILAAYGKDAFVYSSKWTEEDVERLMEIYWEMKAHSDKNDWVYVSNKLYRGFTKDICRNKVKTLLRLNGEKYMKKVAHSPSVSSVTSQPSTVTSQPSTVTSQPSTMTSQLSMVTSQPSTMASQLSTVTSQLSSAAEQTCEFNEYAENNAEAIHFSYHRHIF